MIPLQIQFGKIPDKTPRVSSLYMRLRSRFTIYFFLLVLLPYIAVMTASWFYTRELAEKKAFDMALTNIEHERASIERYVNDLKLAASASAAALEPEMKNGNEASSSLLKKAIEENMSYTQLHTLSAAYVITSEGIKASYGSGADSVAISSPAAQQWFHMAVTEPDYVYVLGTIQRFYSGGRNKTVFCVANAIKGSSREEPDHVLLFDFNYSLLSDFTSANAAGGNVPSERLVVDFEGNVLYSRNQGQLTTTADDALTSAMGSTDNGFSHVTFRGGNYYMTYARYSSLSWIFIDLVPESGVTQGIWLRNPFIVVIVISLPVFLFIYLGLMFRLLKPINELTTVISEYEGQQPGVSGHPPLLRQKLPNSGMGGISDIDYLIDKIYSIKLRQKEAELNSLQNQINPHFLYNTLESIRGAALYNGIHEIAAMSKALSLLFRYSISDRVLVTIREELQHLENYMSIQNFRYENKFELVYSISPDLMNYKILKLTLQPLIENSIKHGLEMKLGKGTVKIEILELDKNIKIQISDDGIGITPKKIEELNRAIAYDKYLSGSDPDRSGTGIGVKNVNSRIKLYFGDQYGLKFREALAGTIVEITLPAVMDN